MTYGFLHDATARVRRYPAQQAISAVSPLGRISPDLIDRAAGRGADQRARTYQIVQVRVAPTARLPLATRAPLRQGGRRQEQRIGSAAMAMRPFIGRNICIVIAAPEKAAPLLCMDRVSDLAPRPQPARFRQSHAHPHPRLAHPRSNGWSMLQLTVGQSATRTLHLTAQHVRAFAEMTGDYNPLHFNEQFAAHTSFGRLVVQGGLTTGLLHALVAMDMPGPGTVFLSQNWKFTAPVYIDDTITARAEVLSVHASKPVTQLGIKVTRGDGTVVLEGEAWCYTFAGGKTRRAQNEKALVERAHRTGCLQRRQREKFRSACRDSVRTGSPADRRRHSHPQRLRAATFSGRRLAW